MTRNRATAVETKVISLKFKIKIKVTSKKLSFYLTVNTNNVYWTNCEINSLFFAVRFWETYEILIWRVSL
jgi:hypothetical protein